MPALFKINVTSLTYWFLIQRCSNIIKRLNNSVYHYMCCCFKIPSRSTVVVKGLQKRRPARKWRDPITARGVRRRRVTSADVVLGLECYNVTIATGRFRLKRWNVTLYHRRRERVLNVTRKRKTRRFVFWREVREQQPHDCKDNQPFGGFIREKYVRIHGSVRISALGKFVTGSFWLTRITWDPSLGNFSDCSCWTSSRLDFRNSESTFWLIRNSSDVICQ